MEIPAQFKKAISTLYLTSFDSGNLEDGIEPRYMSNSDIPVYNFDAIQKWYAEALQKEQGKDDVSSNDALYVAGDKVLFIEFKNGDLKKRGKEKRNLVSKIYNSQLILADSIMETNKIIDGYESDTKYAREHIDYMLVYNEEKNPSSSKDKIGNRIREKGNMEAKIRFGLARFEGYLFRKVRTYTEKEFQENFVDRVNKGEDYV